MLRSLQQIGAWLRAVDPEDLLHDSRHLLHQLVVQARDDPDAVHLRNQVNRVVIGVADALARLADDDHHIVPVADYGFRATPEEKKELHLDVCFYVCPLLLEVKVLRLLYSLCQIRRKKIITYM